MAWVVSASHNYQFGKEKAAKVVAALQQAGYENRPNIDRSQIEKDPTILAKFVIGEAISMLTEVNEIRLIGKSDLALYHRLLTERENSNESLPSSNRGISPRARPEPIDISPKGSHITDAGEGRKLGD